MVGIRSTCRVVDTEGDWEGQICTVGPSLIPSSTIFVKRCLSRRFDRDHLLHSCADGAKNDGEEQCLWLTPLVKHLISDCSLLIVGQALDRLERRWILGNEGPLPEQINDVDKLVVLGELLDVAVQLLG